MPGAGRRGPRTERPARWPLPWPSLGEATAPRAGAGGGGPKDADEGSRGSNRGTREGTAPPLRAGGRPRAVCTESGPLAVEQENTPCSLNSLINMAAIKVQNQDTEATNGKKYDHVLFNL